MDKRQLIEILGLAPHIEGGYFRRTYQSGLFAAGLGDGKPRRLLSSIFYLLTDDSPIGHLHRNRSDILHFFQGGSPLTYWIAHPGGRLEKAVLGFDLAQGQRLQLLVKGGCWKASELEAGEFGLVSEAVAPGFEYEDMELADANWLRREFPQWQEALGRFVRA